MDNKSIAKVFKLCAQLMELHNENPFRTKAMGSAAFKIDKLPFSAIDASLYQLSDQQGIGKSTAEKIKQVVTSGTFPDLESLLAKTPEGILEMLKIKGLGPKKIQIVWKDLAIESVGELYYACNENRLIEAKGFGLKTQEDIKRAIEFTIANEGWILYAKALPSANQVYTHLKNQLPTHRISFTGEFRRKCEVLTHIELLSDASADEIYKAVEKLNNEIILNEDTHSISFKDENNFSFVIYFTSEDDYAKELMITTGSEKHLELIQQIQHVIPALGSEEEIYQQLGLNYIEPELREGLDEVELAKANLLPTLITFEDLKGTLHNHSTYSDGVHTLAEMARYSKEELGLAYLGICDHSKTAVYANGLSIEQLEQQWIEINHLNETLAPFKIFKGIESDILSDGSLDYPETVLAKFDFVVASVHSNLKMEESKATARLIKAIENPYTTILGHPTGRLLLSRAGYPIDYKKVIDACAANNVVIEINANPLRLDLDWRWHRYALDRGVLLSINPDAHRTEGLLDMHYGVFVARKGGLSKGKCLNTYNLNDISAYFSEKKSKINNT
ncbi:DNA polymerase/3'-5' exonuclease PolX [Sphingobacterium olei]|uniref:DNA polymerase/3'-5' exonuclease PolX n=1 Tax=Sphingobacterium olei TaxID=2571155 RepID=A0A4U0NM53_9SPHI|nr:DNA polymerase/3'-5' exonuclease PolX [Sphingobacterium olei]TJZ54902.1 DNA polymerase/3'-5' exonuclease PolX [Sphingobacterium olei]